jgi:hypothetical protein
MIKMNLIHKFILLLILSTRGTRFIDRIKLLEFLGNSERFMISNQGTLWYSINLKGYALIIRWKI